MKILMVCLGNICRSPMAEGILREKAHQEGLDLITDSCGTGGWHAGESPDGRAMRNLKAKGIDISDLKARQFHTNDFQEFDRIYCMDQSNYSDILGLATDDISRAKVKMILNEINPNFDESVPDPYYGGEEGFENVFHLLDQSCEKIISDLKSNG